MRETAGFDSEAGLRALADPRRRHMLALAWDRERGEPPLTRGFAPEAERALLAQAGTWGRGQRP